MGAIPGSCFYIWNKRIEIFRIIVSQTDEGGLRRLQSVTVLAFTSENDLARFVTDALPNCIFEDVVIISCLNKHLSDAVGRVADAVVLKGALHIRGSMNPEEYVCLLRKFRKVEVSFFILLPSAFRRHLRCSI